MYESVFSNASFPHALFLFDVERAAATQAAACPYCGGRLHVANYPRKPRGGPWALAEAHAIRHGLCCAREGCRRRTLPPSVRFLGRRVYLAAVVVLGAVLRQGLTPFRVKRIEALLGADRRTLARWCAWWTTRFARTSTFEVLRASIVPPVAPCDLPRGALDRFVGGPRERLEAFLRLLAEPDGAG